MDADRRAGLERERRRLILAESDMKQVEAGVLLLTNLTINAAAERLVWTGIVVTYARPFVQSNALGPVGEKFARPAEKLQRSLHDRLRELRDDLFVHNEGNELRGEVDVNAEHGLGAGHYTESYAPMDATALPRIAELAKEQREKLRTRLDDLERELTSVS